MYCYRIRDSCSVMSKNLLQSIATSLIFALFVALCVWRYFLAGLSVSQYYDWFWSLRLGELFLPQCLLKNQLVLGRDWGLVSSSIAVDGQCYPPGLWALGEVLGERLGLLVALTIQQLTITPSPEIHPCESKTRDLALSYHLSVGFVKPDSIWVALGWWFGIRPARSGRGGPGGSALPPKPKQRYWGNWWWRS